MNDKHGWVAPLIISILSSAIMCVFYESLIIPRRVESSRVSTPALEPDWDVNSFISASEKKRREGLQAARQGEAFQKVMAAAHEQMEKSFIEDHLGFCEVEIEGLIGKGNPQIYDALADELKRRGFGDVRFCGGALGGRYIMRIDLPRRPWRL